MGMYTELNLHVELNDKAEIDTLRFMVNGSATRAGDSFPFVSSDEPLFRTERWEWMLRCDSYYFEGNQHSALIFDDQKFWSLDVFSNFKNYDGELKLFLEWLYPQVAVETEDRFVGYHRYESADDPTLIYWTPEEFKFVRVVRPWLLLGA